MRRKRQERGVTTLALILFLAAFVLLPLSLFGFELARYILMQTQLQSIVDSAALSGTAALASSPSNLTVAQQHTLAMVVAEQTFEQNSILQTNFNAGNVTANRNSGWSTAAPPLYNATLNIWLLDQNGNQRATGDTNAVVMRIEGRYSDQMVFASNLFPVGFLETAVAVSDGGLPRLDLFLCFDVSGSMDDETQVVYVKRYWGGNTNRVEYQIVHQGDNIYNSTKPPKEGTGLNAAAPQNLQNCSYGPPSNSLRQFIASCSPNPSGNLLHVPLPDNDLRGNQCTYPPGSLPPPLPPAATKYPNGTLIPEQGWPPGNFDPRNRSLLAGNGLNPNVYGNGFTDLIVRVNDVGPYTFPNAAVCVEASRGNLESAAIFEQSRGGAASAINPLLSGVTPQAGYYNAYWSQVRNQAEPIATARAAATEFFNTMNVSSNGHFAFVTFADGIGTTPTSTWASSSGNINNIDGNYAPGGTGAFPLPLVDLNQSQSNFQEVKDALNGIPGTTTPLVATGKTNIADALRRAIDSLTDASKRRPDAKRAIVLFTDGIPNRPVDQATGEARAFTQATRARGFSIPIYTIGLSQNTLIKPDMDRVLGDGNGTPRGIAWRSRNGALYISVTNRSALNQAFQTIARSLCVLQ
ncbi:MAG TPA: VWA domain-containing protein [Candidatus Obscuribacterales bacterium]